MSLDVDLDLLIEAVHVAPGRPAWFKDLVARVMGRYGLGQPAVTSSLDERPNLA